MNTPEQRATADLSEHEKRCAVCCAFIARAREGWAACLDALDEAEREIAKLHGRLGIHELLCPEIDKAGEDLCRFATQQAAEVARLRAKIASDAEGLTMLANDHARLREWMEHWREHRSNYGAWIRDEIADALSGKDVPR